MTMRHTHIMYLPILILCHIVLFKPLSTSNKQKKSNHSNFFLNYANLK